MKGLINGYNVLLGQGDANVHGNFTMPIRLQRKRTFHCTYDRSYSTPMVSRLPTVPLDHLGGHRSKPIYAGYYLTLR